VPPGTDGGFLVAVIQGQPTGRQVQGTGHHVFGDADADAVGRRAAGHQNLPRFFIVDIHAGAFQDFQRANVNAVALLVPHAGIVGAGHAVFVGWYHCSPLFDISNFNYFISTTILR
jgi:hypothetical protein